MFLTKNRTLAFKKEATPGTDAAPTVGANAVRVIGPQISQNLESVNNDDEVTGALDAGQPMPSGGNASGQFQVVLRGSGAGGVAPEYSDLMQCAGFAETITVADVTGTAQAGGASSVTLAVGASAVDDAYKGMPVFIGGGTGSGQSAVITGYVGATRVATVAKAWAVQPDATSTYTIPANVLYRPASAAIPTGTLYDYQHSSAAGVDSRLNKIFGANSSWSMELSARDRALMSFNFQGMLQSPSDVAHPGDATYDAEPGRPVVAASDALFGGAAVKFGRFTLDAGSTVQQGDDPTATYGYDVAFIKDRKFTGTLNPYMVDLATRNALALFMAATVQSIVLRWGTAAGNRTSILVPQAQIIKPDTGDNNGRATDDISFQAIGANNGVFICLH